MERSKQFKQSLTQTSGRYQRAPTKVTLDLDSNSSQSDVSSDSNKSQLSIVEMGRGEERHNKPRQSMMQKNRKEVRLTKQKEAHISNRFQRLVDNLKRKNQDTGEVNDMKEKNAFEELKYLFNYDFAVTIYYLRVGNDF